MWAEHGRVGGNFTGWDRCEPAFHEESTGLVHNSHQSNWTNSLHFLSCHLSTSFVSLHFSFANQEMESIFLYLIFEFSHLTRFGQLLADITLKRGLEKYVCFSGTSWIDIFCQNLFILITFWSYVSLRWFEFSVSLRSMHKSRYVN